jgi:hypothetical protein
MGGVDSEVKWNSTKEEFRRIQVDHPLGKASNGKIVTNLKGKARRVHRTLPEKKAAAAKNKRNDYELDCEHISISCMFSVSSRMLNIISRRILSIFS